MLLLVDEASLTSCNYFLEFIPFWMNSTKKSGVRLRSATGTTRSPQPTYRMRFPSRSGELYSCCEITAQILLGA